MVLEQQKVRTVPTDTNMRELGKSVAKLVKEGDVLLLSGPLGAGKTTFAQGLSLIHISEPTRRPG